MIFGWQMAAKKILVLEIRYETWIFKIEAFICKKKGPLGNFWGSFTEIKVASGLTKVVSKIQENFQNTEKAIFKSFVWFHLDFLLWDAIVQSIET